jgi:hypothetical protein
MLVAIKTYHRFTSRNLFPQDQNLASPWLRKLIKRSRVAHSDKKKSKKVTKVMDHKTSKSKKEAAKKVLNGLIRDSNAGLIIVRR